ncbi:Uncharacterised protein [Klebsiella pneumoniae]|nr:Uncharacterised protein [Klebsiella pneumoniae]
MIDARGGGQAFHRLDVIFGAEYRVEVSHPDGIFTVGCAFSGFSLFGIQPDGTGVKTQSQHRLAKDVHLYAAVTLLAVEAVIASGIGNGVRFFDFKQRQRSSDRTVVDLDAHFVLLRVRDPGTLPGIGRRRRRHRARLQRFGMVSIQRQLLPRLVHQAKRRHPAALGITRRGIFQPGGVAVVAHNHFLMTSSGGKQHFIVKEAEGITQQPALRTAARGDQRIVVVAAKIGVIRHRHIMVVIDISGRVPGRHPPGGRIGMHLRRIAEVHRMRNRAGIEIAAYPAHAADRVDNAVSIQAAHRRIAVFIQKLRRAVGTNFMRMLAAEGAVYRPAIGQVIFCLRHAKLAFNIAIAPLLAVVFAVVRQRRNEIHAADIDAHRTAVERFLLIAEIERGAETVAAVIKPQRSQRGTAFIIIDSAFTLAVHQVDPGAELVVVAETAPQVEGAAHLRIRGIVDANACGRQIFRPLRLEVNHPADTAAGRAVKQAVSPFENFNALQHLGVHHLTRHHARQAAHRHVIAIELKPADSIGLGEVAVALYGLHASVVTDDIGDSFRLLILNQLRGIADDVKRDVHRFLFAKHPQTAAVGDLAIEECRNHQVTAGFKIAGFVSLDDEGLFARLLRGGSVRGHHRLTGGADG